MTLGPFYERLKKVQPHTPVKRIVTTNVKEWFPPLLKFVFTLFAEKKGGYRVAHRDGDLDMAGLLARFDGRQSDGSAAGARRRRGPPDERRHDRRAEVRDG